MATMSGAVRALGMATAVGTAVLVAQPMTDLATGGTKPNFTPAMVLPEGQPAVNSEFDLTSDLVRVSKGENLDMQPLDAYYDADLSPMPFLDAICHAIKGKAVAKDQDLGLLAYNPEQVNKGHLMPLYGSMGLKAPDDVPSIVTENGVRICVTDPGKA